MESLLKSRSFSGEECFCRCRLDPDIDVDCRSNTNEGAGWADYGNDATEAKVYDFLRGQYAPFTNESFSKALDLYPVKDFKNPSGQGQQMYGEARYVCSANLITGNAKRLGLSSYHYHYNNAHLGSNHGSENGAFFGPPATANAEDTALFEDMRKFWTSFVTTGNPVVGDENGLKWEVCSLIRVRVSLVDK